MPNIAFAVADKGVLGVEASFRGAIVVDRLHGYIADHILGALLEMRQQALRRRPRFQQKTPAGLQRTAHCMEELERGFVLEVSEAVAEANSGVELGLPGELSHVTEEPGGVFRVR